MSSSDTESGHACSALTVSVKDAATCLRLMRPRTIVENLVRRSYHCSEVHDRELRNLSPPPREQEKKSSEGSSGSIHPYGRYGMPEKVANHIYHSNSLACQGHFREEGRYGGDRYFIPPALGKKTKESGSTCEQTQTNPDSTLLFQPAGLSHRTPCQGSTLGRPLVSFGQT